MAAQSVRGDESRAGEASAQPRLLLRGKVAGLSEAECAEVIEYIEVMRSLRREAADRGLFGDGFARRVSSMCEGRFTAPRSATN